MSGILCVWAKLPDKAIEWYEKEWVPLKREEHAIHALHCELTPSGFEGEPFGQLDSEWPLCTVYEIDEIQKVTGENYHKRHHPSNELSSGLLAEARSDVRAYRELKTWQADDWDGDIINVASIAASEWHVSSEQQEEIINFYTSFIGPTISSSPDVLRIRLLELETATALQGDSLEATEKTKMHTYFTLIELETEEWPWETVFELAENEKWKKYFEAQSTVKWQSTSYLVKETYTKEDPNGVNETSNPTTEA